jgi:hypothetical protein
MRCRVDGPALPMRADRTSIHWRRILDRAWTEGYRAAEKGWGHQALAYIDDELGAQWFAGHARGVQERTWQG